MHRLFAFAFLVNPFFFFKKGQRDVFLVKRYHVKLASQVDQITKVQADQISKVLKNEYSLRVLSAL